MLVNGLPHFGAEAVVEPGQQTIAGPLTKMRIHGLPRREVFGQEPPLGTGLDQIEDGVDHLAQGGAWTTAFFGGGQEAAEQLPLVVSEVGVVGSDLHRLTGATAKESQKIASQIKRFVRLSFFRQALIQLSHLFQQSIHRILNCRKFPAFPTQ